MIVEIGVSISTLPIGSQFVTLDGVAYSVANTSGGLPTAPDGNTWVVQLETQTPTLMTSAIKVIPTTFKIVQIP